MKVAPALVFVLCFLWSTTFAKEQIQREKIVEKRIKVQKGDRLTLVSPYGDVVVRTWKRPVASIRFVATGIGYPNSLIDSLFRNTDMTVTDHENGSGKIELLPNLRGYGKGNSVNGIVDAKGNVVELTLRYELMVPEDLFLDLDVRMGDVTFENPYKGLVNIHLSYGLLEAKELSGEANFITIDPPFQAEHRSHIGYLKSGYLNAAFDLDIDRSGDIYIDFCRNMHIGKVNKLTVAGRNNNLVLGSVNHLCGVLDETYTATIGDIRSACELRLSHCNDITFSRIDNVKRVHITAFKSSFQLGHLDNVTLDIEDVPGTEIEQAPSYLRHNKKNYTATLGNGSGTIDIKPYGHSTVSFVK